MLQGTQADQKVWEDQYLKDENGNELKTRDGKPIKVWPDQCIRSAVELIAITQIAESAPPQESYFQKLINEGQDTQEMNDIVKKSGRVPGMNEYF